MTPKQFLSAHGIDLNKTALLTEIGGYLRQPDLCWLLDEYAKEKFKELAKKGETEGLTDDDFTWMEGATKAPIKSQIKVDVSLESGTGHI